MKKTAVVIVLILAVSAAVLFPFPAAALNENYVGDASYWYRKGEAVNIDDGAIKGVFKYLLDDENGCAYFYFHFSGDGVKMLEAEDISLGFSVTNSESSYSFGINSAGFTSDSDKNIDEAIGVKYDFSNVKCSQGVGEIYAALELKSKKDKSLTNNISCSFFKSKSDSIKLLEAATLDMYTYTTVTVKTTAEKTTKTTEAKQTKQTTQKAVRTTAEKTIKATGNAKTSSSRAERRTTAASEAWRKSTAQKTTKFKYSGTAKGSVRQTSTKLSPSADNQTEYSAGSAKDTAALSTDAALSDTSEASATALATTELKMSRKATALMIFAIILILIGVCIIAYAVFAGKYRLVKYNSSENERKEKENTSFDEND